MASRQLVLRVSQGIGQEVLTRPWEFQLPQEAALVERAKSTSVIHVF